MGQDSYLLLKKSGQSVIDQNLPYRFLRGEPLKYARNVFRHTPEVGKLLSLLSQLRLGFFKKASFSRRECEYSAISAHVPFFYQYFLKLNSQKQQANLCFMFFDLLLLSCGTYFFRVLICAISALFSMIRKNKFPCEI